MLPALSIAIAIGLVSVVAQSTVDTGLKGTVTAGVVVIFETLFEPLLVV